MPAYKLLSFDDDGAIKAGIEDDGFIFNLASKIAFHGPEFGIDDSSLDAAIRRWSDLELILTKIANSPSTRAKLLDGINYAHP